MNKRSIRSVIAVIALVNAIGYGIIIPVIYSYSKKFGLTDIQNGLLFSLYSFCQFLATPIIGKLSDIYGRKPMLVLSLMGTAVSFFLSAFAPNTMILFFARALDGITAGNITVAMAVISDVTDTKDRAKGFGIIGATFGLGLVLGPAISGLTLPLGIHMPFIVAGLVAVIAVSSTLFFLPETKPKGKALGTSKLFDFRALWRAFQDSRIRLMLFFSFSFMLIHSLYVYAFQPYAVNVLHVSVTHISYLFMGIGVVGLFAQGFMLGKVLRWMGERRLLSGALLVSSVLFFFIGLSTQFFVFGILVIILAFVFSFIGPVIQALLSKAVDETSQGAIMGISTSYQSIGTIMGPIAGGIIANKSSHLPFFAASVITLSLFLLSLSVIRMHIKKMAL